MVDLQLQVCPVDQERDDHLPALWDLTSLRSPYLKEGESNLKFIWCMFAKCDMDVPSITKVKAFKLPGLVPPIQDDV